MRADDLVPLVAPEEDEAATRYAQGRIVSWDQSTGRNRVNVSGTELQDIPILNTAEAIALRVGHIVGLLRWKSQWFILGRLVVPGGPDFASSSIAFDGNKASRRGFAGTGNYDVPIVTVSIPVPKWATKALVTLNEQLSMNNTSGALSNLKLSNNMRVDNALVITDDGMSTASPNTYWAALAMSNTRTLDVAGAQSVTGELVSDTGWPYHADNLASVNISAIFRSQ